MDLILRGSARTSMARLGQTFATSLTSWSSRRLQASPVGALRTSCSGAAYRQTSGHTVLAGWFGSQSCVSAVSLTGRSRGRLQVRIALARPSAAPLN